MTYTPYQEKPKQELRASLCLTWSLAETDVIESAISWSLREENIWLSPVKTCFCTVSNVLCFYTFTTCSSEVDSVHQKPAVQQFQAPGVTLDPTAAGVA